MNASATAPIRDVEIRHFHLFAGLGGGARGFNRGAARVGNLRARFRCIGGVDVDPAATADFGRLAGVPGTCLDLFDEGQYRAFHGCAPPPGWREAGPDDIRRAAGGERPHIVFLSAPCKGFSGLLSESRSGSAKYQALNRLTLRGVFLMLEAWKDDPPDLIVFENVPRIGTRGRALLDRIVALLRAYGYAVAETVHDCGEIGGLAQSRKRFLLVARHMAKVPPFLYQPEKHRLRGVGDVLGRFPLPGDPAAGPMHRVPSLQWKTWVRLAFVEAGADWRSLNRLKVVDGHLADYLIVPATPHNGHLGVHRWDAPTGTVTSEARPTNGAFSVADPRRPGGIGPHPHADTGRYGVADWRGQASTVTGQASPGQGRFAVADPRTGWGDGAQQGPLGVRGWEDPARTIAGKTAPTNGAYAVADPRATWSQDAHRSKLRVQPWDRPSGTVTGSQQVGSGAGSVADPRFASVHHNNVFRVVRWSDAAGTVTGGHGPSSGGQAVADPRPVGPHQGGGPGSWAGASKYRVSPWDGQASTVIGASTTGQGAFAVQDPRPVALSDAARQHYLTGGHYGVVPWDRPAGAIPAHPKNNNGPWSVADPRIPDPPPLPGATDRGVYVIQALDETWHRPFTTLELAALQSLVEPEEHLELEGLSDSAWRERIGNAVPPAAAEAIAGVMGTTLLLAWSGQTFLLSAAPIWVRPVAIALSVAGPALEGEAA